MATAAITTARELLETAELNRFELVRGELLPVAPSGYEHGKRENRIGVRISNYIGEKGLGDVIVGDVGFLIERDPDTVRAPDVAFVRKERCPPPGTPGFFEGPPDLAVEILSPHDRAGEVLAKVRQWLEAGSRSVWVVDPQTRTVSVYRPGGEARVHGLCDELIEEELLPGFRLAVAEIFAD